MGSSNEETIKGWFAGRVPEAWFTGPPDVSADRDEVLVVGTLADVELGAEASAESLAAARSGRIRQHREDTRGARIRIAEEAERRFGRKVSWGASCGDVTELFTTLSLPMMTRLRMLGSSSSGRPTCRPRGSWRFRRRPMPRATRPR